jgi:hypothetical protein
MLCRPSLARSRFPSEQGQAQARGGGEHGVRAARRDLHLARSSYARVEALRAPGRIRPAPGAHRREVLHWDEPHGDYLYTDAWVRRLVRDLANPARFKAVTGSAPRKLAASTSGRAKTFEDGDRTCGEMRPAVAAWAPQGWAAAHPEPFAVRGAVGRDRAELGARDDAPHSSGPAGAPRPAP